MERSPTKKPRVPRWPVLVPWGQCGPLPASCGGMIIVYKLLFIRKKGQVHRKMENIIMSPL